MSDFSGGAKKPRVNSISMGCRIAPPPVCLTCGDLQGSCEHARENDFVRYVGLQGGAHISFAMVPGPICETCEVPMSYTGHSTLWHCLNEDCYDTGNVVNPGFGGVIFR